MRCSYILQLAERRSGLDKPVGWIPVKMTGSNCLRGLLPFELDAYDRIVVGKHALPRDRSWLERRDGPASIFDMMQMIQVKYNVSKSAKVMRSPSIIRVPDL